jgi:hypothetical protein
VWGRHTGARQAGSTSPQTDTLAQVWAQSDPLGMTLFDYTQAIPSNGREIVDNARFSYGIRARSNMGQGGSIHGISLSYTF